MSRRTGDPQRASRGQILIVFAVATVSILATAGLVIDGVRLYGAQRAAQSAADLAALAGALDLPDDPDDAEDAAEGNAQRNGYGDVGGTTVSALSPLAGNPNRIEVTITRGVSMFFMPVVGIREVTVTARAVASNRVAGYALFAGYNSCNAAATEAIHWTGSNATVVGAVHSNGGIKISGSNNEIDGQVSYHCNNKFLDSGSGNTYGSGPDRTGQEDWPVDHDAAAFGCTFVVSDGTDIGSDAGPWWESPGKSSNRLKAGTYCALGTIKLSGSDISGRVTLIAFGNSGKVLVSASNLTLLPFAAEVLAISQGTGPDAISFSGSGGASEGMLYARAGRVSVSGSDNMTLRGSIVADTITISGSDWQLVADDPDGRGPQLIE